MRVATPARFSRAWWISMVIGGIAGAASFAAVLFYLLDAPGKVVVLLVVAFGAAVGDILTAMYLEMFAPTRVTIRPGEIKTSDEEVRETAVVVDGFEGNPSGRVRVRGEVWRARHPANGSVDLRPGEEARIVGREGLTLFIRASRDVA